jgi:cation diffusion facilitator family transporter
MTLSVSVLLFLTCYQILQGAVQRLRSPVVPQVGFWTFASLFLSIAVHAYTARYELRRGRELKSEFLIADVSHTRADILVTVGVIAGLVVVIMGYPVVDTALAVVIAFLIAKIGVEIIRNSGGILIDAAALETERVEAVVCTVPGVESFHHIRSRGQEDDIHLDLHIRVAPDMSVSQAHWIAHQVEDRLVDEIEGVRDVVVHVEPQPESGQPTQPDL